MKSILAAAILSLNVLLVPSVLAQADGISDDPTEITASESPSAPTNVQPAGLAEQDWQPGDAAVRAIPSPIGPALPGALLIEPGPYGVQATLLIDGKLQRYTYDCDSGRCSGFATDLWRLLPPDQRQSYLDAVLDALIASYPDRRMYIADLKATPGPGFVSARAITYDGNPRAYRFFPAQ